MINLSKSRIAGNTFPSESVGTIMSYALISACPVSVLKSPLKITYEPLGDTNSLTHEPGASTAYVHPVSYECCFH